MIRRPPVAVPKVEAKAEPKVEAKIEPALATAPEIKLEAKPEAAPPSLIAWHVTEARKEGEKGFWTRIGAAWEHEDGQGLTLQLDLVPVSGGRIVLRAPKAEAESETAQQQAA